MRFGDLAYREIWLRDPTQLPRAHAAAVRLVRFLWVLMRDATAGQLTLRAMGLVYTTLLSLVPLLAFAFAVLRAFGAHNELEPVLQRALAPLGDRGPEITARIIGFVDNVQVGVLGSVGLLILLYTVISLVQKIEDGFNYAWRVPKGRSLARRFSGYISVIMVGPLLVFGALGLIGMAQSQAVIEWLLELQFVGTAMALTSRLLPIAMIAAAFTLFYILVPNTRVRFWPALAGGVAAAVLWDVVGSLFASVVVASGRHTAIYATFAAPLLFMLWLYVSWVILLLGTQIAFYLQNPQFVTARRGAVELDHALKERLALAVMYMVAHAWQKPAPRWTFDALSRQLRIDHEPLTAVVNRLVHAGLLTHLDDGDALAPARDPAAITLFDIVDSVRHGGALAAHLAAGGTTVPMVEAVQSAVDDAVRAALGDRTLRDLVAER